MEKLLLEKRSIATRTIQGFKFYTIANKHNNWLSKTLIPKDKLYYLIIMNEGTILNGQLIQLNASKHKILLRPPFIIGLVIDSFNEKTNNRKYISINKIYYNNSISAYSKTKEYKYFKLFNSEKLLNDKLNTVNLFK